MAGFLQAVGLQRKPTPEEVAASDAATLRQRRIQEKAGIGEQDPDVTPQETAAALFKRYQDHLRSPGGKHDDAIISSGLGTYLANNMRPGFTELDYIANPEMLYQHMALDAAPGGDSVRKYREDSAGWVNGRPPDSSYTDNRTPGGAALYTRYLQGRY